jgi:transcriptional regulator GlxA family with amidase domain
MPSRPAPHRVLIVAFPPAQMLDVTGPLEVFSIANAIAHAAGQAEPYALALAGPEAGALACTAGIPLMASAALGDPALAPDTLLIAGGPGSRMVVSEPDLIAALTLLCRRTPRIGSICTGAFALAATGLLDGRRATTHWAHFDEFAGIFPHIELDRDALFVGDGHVHSSAGITAGIDFALALVERDLGRRVALQIARELVLFLKRPGGQSQYSAQLVSQSRDRDGRFGELIEWMQQHLHQDLSVEVLAGRAAMSTRNFTRRFSAALQATPAQFVQALRVDAARRYLTDTNLPVARIAERCGFASAEAMRLAFQKLQRMSPAEFRERFQSACQTGSGR